MCETFSLSCFFCFFPAFAAFAASPSLQPQNHKFASNCLSHSLSLFKHTRARFERKVRNSLPFPRLSLFYIVAPGKSKHFFCAFEPRELLLLLDFKERRERITSIRLHRRRVSFVSFFRINFLSLSLSLSFERGVGKSADRERNADATNLSRLSGILSPQSLSS